MNAFANQDMINTMAYSLAVAGASFVIALLWGRPLIRLLKQLRIGKRIREEGPNSHLAKSGTPTMGGVLVLGTVLVVTVALNLVHRYSILLPLGLLIGCGLLGAVDDLLNLVGGTTMGITARFKFFWQLVMAGAAAFVLHYVLDLTSVYIPFVGKFNIGGWYLPIAVFWIVAFSNAVNITDGLDSLAGGTLALAFAAFGFIAFLQQQAYLVTFCFTITGAMMAFLWFNAHPAQVFMGDTGALALGATLGVVALMTGQWLLLPVVGIVFVAEVSSVALQVIYFKLTKGKRLLRMSPLHHHFELGGWSEPQVTQRLWLIGAVAAMIGIALALV